MHITVWKYAEKQDKEVNYMRRKFRKILALTTAIAVVAGVLPLDGGALSSKITNGGLTVSAAEFTSPETGNGVTPEEDPEVTFSDNDASVESAEALFTDNDTADNEGALQDREEEITVQSVQNLIDALPSSEEVSEMSFEEQEKVYEKLQNAYETYETLTEEEKSQLTGMDAFDELFDYFNGMVSAAGAGESNGLTVTQSNGDTDFYVYDENSHTLTINKDTGDGTITISGTTTVDRIVVEGGNTVNIILDDVNIQQFSEGTSAFLIETGAIVNLTLVGENILQSGFGCAGLQVEGTLNITGGENDSLHATGGSKGAGIGGGNNQAGGTINIEGGTVTATGGTQGAGIGGGSSGAGGKINITGGTVTATGGSTGAGIGGCFKGAGGDICIEGGTVTATGNGEGAGIGGGSSGAGGKINITGGEVTATGGAYGTGIGGGAYKAGGDISITGGTVTANAGCYNSNQGGGGAGIGAGSKYNPQPETKADSIVINGGIVTANSFRSDVADIGNSKTFFSTTIMDAEGHSVPGSAVITCKNKGILCSTESGAWQCIVINEPSKTCTVYGNNMTLNTGLTIQKNYKMTILSGNSLIISNGVTLTNNGTISGNGTIDLSGGGSITGAAVGSGVTLKCSVKRTGSENIIFTGGSDADNQQGYSANLYAKEGYVLPDKISVRIDGNPNPIPAAASTVKGYTYDKTNNSATLTIPGELITGNIVINIKAKYEIELTPADSETGLTVLDFGEKTYGYSSAPAKQVITVTNIGEQEVVVGLPSSVDYDFAWTSEPNDNKTLKSDENASFSVQPKKGLNTGIYENTITVSTVPDSNSVSDSFTAKFRVKPIPYSYYTITASAGTGGTITPSGSCSIREWLDKTFTITPDSGYEIADVLVDGKSVGAQSSYTFKDVISNHTISASFLKIVPQEYPDGTKAKPDGSFETPNGTVILPDGTIVLPDGIRIELDEDGNRPVIDKDNVVTAPDGTVYKPDGTVHNTDGSVQDHAGTYLSPAKAWVDFVNAAGNKITILLTGEAAGAAGYDYVIGTSADMLKTREYYKISKNKLGTETLMQYVEKGTYYAACHAWIRGTDGKKVFGLWSELKEFRVDAVTPETPKIKNVKVSKQTVTVTYTVCSDAEGYDIVLGKEYKKVNEEKRPVNYGTLVKKVKNGNTVTVTFRNVTPGTYYAGLHSWNRTSEDGKKVFSPWSGVKKVVVK